MFVSLEIFIGAAVLTPVLLFTPNVEAASVIKSLSTPVNKAFAANIISVRNS